MDLECTVRGTVLAQVPWRVGAPSPGAVTSRETADWSRASACVPNEHVAWRGCGLARRAPRVPSRLSASADAGPAAPQAPP